MAELFEKFEAHQRRTEAEAAERLLGGLVQKDQYVGEVFSVSYEKALVQIHDHHRQKVGGIPSLCFLAATRVEPEPDEIDHKKEDAWVILLRVKDAAPLPNQEEALRVRVQAAQRVSGDPAHWDERAAMDPSTHQLLSFAGMECRVLGTFYLKEQASENGQQGEGPPYPESPGEKYKRKFQSKETYQNLLERVFTRSARVMTDDATVYVRTDAREYTFDTTRDVLRKCFPEKDEKLEEQPVSGETQTALYGDKTDKPGEFDIIMQ